MSASDASISNRVLKDTYSNSYFVKGSMFSISNRVLKEQPVQEDEGDGEEGASLIEY